MSKSKFDLQAALDKLHEDDWLNPTMPGQSDVAPIKVSNEEHDYSQHGFWLSQFAQLLEQHFQLTSRGCARVLGVSSHSMIVRAINRYPDLKFDSLTDAGAALRDFCQQMGVITYE